MPRALGLMFIVAGLFATGATEAESEPPRIVVVTHGQAADPFWSVVKNGIDRAEADMSVEVDYLAPASFDMIKMARMIEAAIASRPDGLVVSIPDADALGDAIRAAVGAGVPVVSINSGGDVSHDLGVLLHVGQTEFEAGVGGGERMAAEGVTKAICVNQEVGNVALDRRCEGFAKGLGGDVEVLSTSLDPTQTRNAVSAYLTRHPDTNGILTLGPSPAEAALQALETLGRPGVDLATFDLSPAVLQALVEKKLLFAIDQQQYLQGYLPIVVLALHHRYGLLPASDVRTGPGFVTPENAARVIDLSARGIR